TVPFSSRGCTLRSIATPAYTSQAVPHRSRTAAGVFNHCGGFARIANRKGDSPLLQPRRTCRRQVEAARKPLREPSLAAEGWQRSRDQEWGLSPNRAASQSLHARFASGATAAASSP